MVKILTTGSTGYIGGDALYAIANAHPEYDITCTVRSSSKGAQVAKQYPNIKLVYGDLDSHDMLADEASKADIVLNFADCDHVGGAKTLVEGLSRRENGGFLIHTSGTGILTYDDRKNGLATGQSSKKVYDDWDGVGEVTSLPDEAPHRPVDKIVLGAGEASGGRVKTAIVCPPTINGQGRGPGSQRSDQVPKLAEEFFKRGKGFVPGDGQNCWSSVHVHDLSDVYLKLTEAAAEGGGKATWGPDGYYFTENGEFLWGDIAKQVADEAHRHGYITTPELERLDGETGQQISLPSRKWGRNSRGTAIRARKVLSWDPKGDSIEKMVPWIVEQEAVAAGLKKGHAAKAAGDA